MKSTGSGEQKQKPAVEINKPPEPGFWQRPEVRFPLYLLLVSIAWFFWQTQVRLARETIPYSQFLQYLEQDKIDKVLVSDSFIEGTLKPAKKVQNESQDGNKDKPQGNDQG